MNEWMNDKAAITKLWPGLWQGVGMIFLNDKITKYPYIGYLTSPNALLNNLKVAIL